MSNMIILMSDEHNPFFSSVYGNPTVQTPNMERLANRGTLFANAYCPSPLCMPSRSAFMSGRRAHELQVYSNCSVHVKRDVPSYGAVLNQQGIYSVNIGKTDVYDDSVKLGFSEMYLGKDRKSVGDIHFGRRPLSIRTNAAVRAKGYGIKEEAFDDDLNVVDTALDWLWDHVPKLKQPWCLTINILNPHLPQWNTKEFWDMYPDGGSLPEFDGSSETAQHPYAQDLRAHFQTDQFSEEQIRGLRRGYLGNISFVDQQLGRILDEMEEGGLFETTNIIYTSDHGDMMGKFGLWWKCSLFEDSVRVPCIAAGPDFTAGRIVKTPVDLHDVQAAIFHSVAAVRPKSWIGSPLQEIEENDTERVVFSEYHGHGTRSGAYIVRKGDWKLIYCMEAPHLLFCLADDPQEMHNLYDYFPDKAQELERELRLICSPEAENDRAHLFQEEQLHTLGI